MRTNCINEFKPYLQRMRKQYHSQMVVANSDEGLLYPSHQNRR